MTKYFYMGVFWLFSLPGLTQQVVNSDSTYSLNGPGDIHLQVSPDLMFFNGSDMKFAGGLKLEYFFSRKIGFNGVLTIGNNCGYFNMGIISIPIFLILKGPDEVEFESFEEFLLRLLLIVTVFESPAIHFPINDRSDISLNLSVLRFRWTPEEVESNTIQVAAAAGLQINLQIGKFMLSPFGDVSVGYSDFKSVITTGVLFGPIFKSR